jgi:hypothetical protein
VVGNQLEVARNFTWAVLGMEDGNFWHLGGVTRWNSQFFNKYMSFSRHHSCCFIVVPLFVLDKSMAYNRCLQHPCFKNLCKIAQASKNSDSNAQHFLSDLLTHSWFHSMLFALPSYQFSYIVMSRCLYLMTQDEVVDDQIRSCKKLCVIVVVSITSKRIICGLDYLLRIPHSPRMSSHIELVTPV